MAQTWLQADATFGLLQSNAANGTNTLSVNVVQGAWPVPSAGQKFGVLLNPGTGAGVIPLDNLTTERLQIGTVTGSGTYTLTLASGTLAHDHFTGEYVVLVILAAELNDFANPSSTLFPTFDQVTMTPNVVSVSGTYTIDASTFQKWDITMTANTVFTITNMVPGRTLDITLRGAFVPTWPSTVWQPAAAGQPAYADTGTGFSYSFWMTEVGELRGMGLVGVTLAGLGGAPLASPVFTGNPTATTQTALTNNATLATTAYADAADALHDVALPRQAVQTAATYTAVANTYAPIDTTSRNIVVTLPTAPPNLTRIALKMIVQGGTNTVTVNTGGSDTFDKVSGSTSDTISLLGGGRIYQYDSSSDTWTIIVQGAPLSSYDARYLLLSGGTMTGAIAMGGNKVTGGGLATASTDLASLANTIDQFGAAAANLNFNSHKGVNVTNGSGAQDVAAFGQIPLALPPFTAITATASTLNPAVANTAYIVNTGGESITLPSNASLVAGQMFLFTRGTATGLVTINAGASTTINNAASITIGASATAQTANDGMVWLLATSTTTLIVIAAANCDGSLNSLYSGTANFQSNVVCNGQISFNSRLIFNQKTKTTSYTTLFTDNYIELTGSTAAQTLTLGTTTFTTGQEQRIKNASSQTWTIAAASGTTDVTTLAAGGGLIMIFDGTNWKCLGSH